MELFQELFIIFQELLKRLSLILYPHSSISRALSSLRDADANSVVGGNPVMGDLIAVIDELVCAFIAENICLKIIYLTIHVRFYGSK